MKQTYVWPKSRSLRDRSSMAIFVLALTYRRWPRVPLSQQLPISIETAASICIIALPPMQNSTATHRRCYGPTTSASLWLLSDTLLTDIKNHSREPPARPVQIPSSVSLARRSLRLSPCVATAFPLPVFQAVRRRRNGTLASRACSW